jgi:fructokinase
MIESKPLVGGVELGGTKCVCIIGTGPDDIRMQVSIPTGNDPEATLRQIEEILRQGMALQGPINALGIASFGPVDLAHSSPTFGYITSTPKPGWRDTPVATRLQRAFPVPLGFDTDVNAAARAEGRWGAARDLTDFVYITVGTGVGVGLMVGGRPAGGFTHSELGHIRIARAAGDAWPGVCVFHGDCVEGLVSGPALAARAGLAADKIPADSPVWEFAAHALAQLLHTLVLATAPRRIVIGGGVAEGHPELLGRVRAKLVESLNGYLDLELLVGDIDAYVIPPALKALAGPLGALALATDAI